MYFHSLSRSSLSDFSKATQQITRRVTIRLLVCPTLSLGAPGFPAWGCSPLELFLVSAEGEGSSLEEGRAPLLIGEENKRKEGAVNHTVISKWLYSLHIVCTHASSKQMFFFFFFFYHPLKRVPIFHPCPSLLMTILPFSPLCSPLHPLQPQFISFAAVS